MVALLLEKWEEEWTLRQNQIPNVLQSDKKWL